MGDTFIIAEVGINHGGSFYTAKYLVDLARDCGADAVKFQTSFTMPHMKQWEFSKEQWKELFAHCDEVGIRWFSTPFDFEAIDFLNECGMDIWKIPSGMLTNYEYLEKIRSIYPKRIILSTGMGNNEEIEEAYFVFKKYKNINILHCVSVYPTPYDEVNLNVFRKNPWVEGLSDHTQGIEIPIAAVALGAMIIEKHFTLDRNQEGPDHKASLEPDEFKEMVRCIRNVELAMGDGIKQPTKSELKVRDKIRGIMGCATV